MNLTDTLIGVYVTNEPLNLEPDQHVVATQADDPAYAFAGIDGFIMLEAFSPGMNISNSAIWYCSESIDATSASGVNSNDTTGAVVNTLDITGTLYVGGDSGTYTAFLNPIYETPDGQVYLVKADTNPITVDPGAVDEGFKIWSQLNQTITTTENGKATTNDVTVSMGLAVIKPPTKIVVWQMSNKNQVLANNAYEPGKVPSTIKPKSGVAFLIVETDRTDSSVDRELISPDTGTFRTYAPRADSTFIGYTTTVTWP